MSINEIEQPLAGERVVALSPENADAAATDWLRRPNPWPKTFGYHEVNHLVGLPGAVAHYVAIWHLLT